MTSSSKKWTGVVWVNVTKTVKDTKRYSTISYNCDVETINLGHALHDPYA